MTSLRILFVANRLQWPRQSGTDVHGSQMMRALANRGHRVFLGTFEATSRQAVDGLGLSGVWDLSRESSATSLEISPPTRLQAKFESYWGTDPQKQAAIAGLTRRESFDAVVVLGADALPLFRGIRAGVRVWYAADDAGLHHWSRVRWLEPGTWGNVQKTAVHALYERAFARLVDRIWVVSEADRRAMQWATGWRRPVDVIANGVDADCFCPPTTREEIPESCVFWGRLDFAPNEEAVEWFLRRCWPHVRSEVPSATLSIFGFRPSPRVTDLCHQARSAGVELVADLPDLRGEVCRRAVTVLPFVSGRGIKNKLLEAAGMGRAIACTPTALTGCRGTPPVECEGNPRRLASAIVDLFRNQNLRQKLGSEARSWVLANHTWDAAAEIAEAGLIETSETRTGTSGTRTGTSGTLETFGTRIGER